MVFSFRISTFCYLPLILHKVEQKLRKLPFTNFPHSAFYYRDLNAGYVAITINFNFWF